MVPLLTSKLIIFQLGSIMDTKYSQGSAEEQRKLGNLKWLIARLGTQNSIMLLDSSSH